MFEVAEEIELQCMPADKRPRLAEHSRLEIAKLKEVEFRAFVARETRGVRSLGAP